MKRIAIIPGHPTPGRGHLCHALQDAYEAGARGACHHVTNIDIAMLDFPLLRSQQDWLKGAPETPTDLRHAQQAIVDADHIVLIYPLWLGTMPALLKGFLEQVLRPGVALSYEGRFPKALLKGKTARIVVTMGMPAMAYRWYYGAHSLKGLKRNILVFVGLNPIRHNLFGMVEKASIKRRQGWLGKMNLLGASAR